MEQQGECQEVAQGFITKNEGMKIRRLIGSMLLAPWVEDDCLIVWLAELCADCCFSICGCSLPFALSLRGE